MKNVNSDIAYDFIRRRILTGEFLPGHPLMTKELAKKIGVSRTPVRDALRQLEADGLVIIRARLGASVRAMDLKEFSEICEVRLALETHAAGLAAQNRVEADLHEMRFALESMRRLAAQIIAAENEQSLLSEMLREDVRFHVAVIAAAKNDLIKKEILRLHLMNRMISAPLPNEANARLEQPERDGRRSAVLAEHQAIFEAVANGDVATAKHAMEIHIQSIIEFNILTMGRAANRAVARELTEEELSYMA